MEVAVFVADTLVLLILGALIGLGGLVVYLTRNW
jgi:hypothetical protein